VVGRLRGEVFALRLGLCDSLPEVRDGVSDVVEFLALLLEAFEDVLGVFEGLSCAVALLLEALDVPGHVREFGLQTGELLVGVFVLLGLDL